MDELRMIVPLARRRGGTFVSQEVTTQAGKPCEGLRHGRNLKTVIEGAKGDQSPLMNNLR